MKKNQVTAKQVLAAMYVHWPDDLPTLHRKLISLACYKEPTVASQFSTLLSDLPENNDVPFYQILMLPHVLPK
ncbi:hypothetical protein ACP70R_025343 [Stipagrostis hirtigluma subsp. patula]